MRHVDLHIHGAFGVDVVTADAAELDRLALGLEGRGYDAFLPTLVPLPLDALEATLARLGPWIGGRFGRDRRGALPLGVHFEGPFLQPARAGALDPRAFLDGRDDAAVARFLALLDALPGRHAITVAPEIPGGLELIAELQRRGLLVSIGHTDADLATLERAVAAGARHMTHFCNAMRPLHHREPGPIGFGLVCDAVTVELIADLHHVHPEIVKLVLRVKGAERVALVSDAVPAAGLGDGEHRFWGETLTVRDGVVRNAAGALAGSVALLGDQVERLVSLGVERAAALECAGAVPMAILRAGGE